MSKRNTNRRQPLVTSEATEGSRVDELIEDELEKEGRPWLRWGLFLLLGLVLIVLAIPTIVSKTTAGSYLLSKVIPAEAGELTFESMNLGWFSPLQIDHVRFVDAAGEPLLQVDKITGNRSLLALARNPTDLGSIVVNKPIVMLTLRDDGSNLEDTLAKLVPTAQTEETASSSTMVSANIKLIDAVVHAKEVATQTVHQLSDVNIEANLPESAAADWVVNASGALNGKPFEVNIATPLGQATAEWPLGPTGKAQVRSDDLPLASLRYVASRVGQPIEQIQGTCTSNLVANWEPSPQSSQPKLVANGFLRLDGLLLASQSLLGKDVLRLNSAQLSTKVSLVNNQAIIEQGELTSDFGKANLVTAMHLDSLSDSHAIIDAIRQQRLNSTGEIDLAQLTKMLPNTMKIQDDVDIASGRISWHINTDVQPNGTKWTGDLQTADIRVLRGGQPIDWQFPLEVRFSAVDDRQEVVVESLTARSDFFALAGQGRLREGKLHAQADLERLVFQLDQVMDLGNIYVRGQMQSIVQWDERQTNQVSVDAKAKLTDFQMRQDTLLLCEEKELNTAAVATATLAGQQIASLDSARIDVVSGPQATPEDYFVAQLQAPVLKPSTDSNWNVACRLNGEITNWLGRLKTLGIAHEWQGSGQVDATVHTTANMKQAVVHKLTADVRNLRVKSDGIDIQEPVFQVQSAGNVDLTTFACRFPETTVASQSVSLSAREFSIAMEPHFAATGNLSYRADLGRLMSYFPSETFEGTPTQQLNGGAVGRVSLNAQGDTTTFNLEGAVENFVVTDETGAQLWQEPELTMQVQAAYDGKQDAIELTQAQVAGKVVNMVAQGRATGVSTSPVVDLSGEYGYDLAGIVTIFRGMIGPDVELQGNQRQRFAVQGPLFPADANSKALVSNELAAQAGMGWDSVNAYGVGLSKAQFDARLQQGVLQTTPMEMSVGGEGKLRLIPTVHVNSEPMWLTLQPGLLAENVRLDPQMTGGWMRYVTPLLADATSAEGTFSVTLSRAEVPLVDPMAGQVEGQLDFHGGSLGPGAMANQLIQVATQVKQLIGRGESRIADPTKSWVQIEPQQINFQMAENRVFHEGFRMTIDGVQIQTRGSVGIVDQSLAVMAEVPILDEWIESSPNLAGLRGQVISIPIQGTTSKPQLDQRALAQVSMQIARQGATGYLQNQLNEKLGGKLNEALGDQLGGALGQGLKGFLGGNQATPATGNPAMQNVPAQTPSAGSLATPLNGGAPATSTPPAGNQLQNQLQNRVQDELGRQFNKLFQ